MSLAAGEVAVDDDEVETGSGCALALYLADKDTMPLPPIPTLDATSPAPYSAGRPVRQTDIDQIKSQRVAALRDAARRATAYASVIQYFLDNYEAGFTITSASEGGGLQRYNNGVSNVDTLPPAFPGRTIVVSIA